MSFIPRCLPNRYVSQCRLRLFIGALLTLAASREATAEKIVAARPNVVFILADDLGYGDLGCYGQQKIRTPHLDRIAAEGVRLTQHYSGNAVCAPSRCVLMTALHPGHAYVRDNRSVGPEGQTPLPADTVTLPKLLKQAGYATGAFGKWGLGGPETTGQPLKQGIDRFFGYNCQAIAHGFYPEYLWDNDRRLRLENEPMKPHQKLPVDADPNSPESYRKYIGKQYSADLITEQALQFVRDHRQQPFFLFWPTTVPHLALQVPEDSLAEYQGKFPEQPYLGDRGYLPHQSPRAAYAAMITRMDREIGRLLALLKELSLDEQTIIVFSSDNGPLYDQTGGTDAQFFASAGPLRGFKGSLYEGGFRVPGLIRWPGKIQAGLVSDRVSGFEDWLPTLLELIGRPDLTPSGIDGISLVPTLVGESQPERSFLYREFPGYNGWQVARMGDWKAVRHDLNPRGKNKQPNLSMELYNLRDDLGEQRDRAAEHPELVRQFEELLLREHRNSPEFPLPALDKS